jgi:ATP/maltotriose-dependent transcriptional regulator MalT
VIQAVGRVRFATRPREVITFQCGELPEIRLTAEFRTLQEARDHFGLLPGAELDRQLQEREVQRLRAEGLTVMQIAEKLAISERTVYYRLRAARSREDRP